MRTGIAYRVFSLKEFRKDFAKLDLQLQRQVSEKIEEMAEDPTRYKHLHYALAGSCRIRIGKLRIIYSYDIKRQEVYLERIVLKHRY